MTLSDLDHFSALVIWNGSREGISWRWNAVSPRANPLFYIFHSHKKRVDGIRLGVVEGVGDGTWTGAAAARAKGISVPDRVGSGGVSGVGSGAGIDGGIGSVVGIDGIGRRGVVGRVGAFGIRRAVARRIQRIVISGVEPWRGLCRIAERSRG
jgi:hypothetical protein